MRFFSKLFLSSRLKLIVPIFGSIVLALFSSLILYEATKAQVVIVNDGESQVIKTHSKTVGELLKEVGITFKEHDALSYDKDVTIENGIEIDYKKSKKIYVTINNNEEEFNTVADTVGEFLQSESLEFSDRDDISHEENAEIEAGIHILVKEAYPVVINDGGEKVEVWTTGASIEQLLDTNEITLRKSDKVKPAIDKNVDHNTVISIVRVDKKTEVIEESLTFETEKKQDSSLAKGKEKVLSKGQEGTVIKEYSVVLENGKEVDRELVSEDVKEKSKNRVVAIGTKESEQKLVTLASKSSNNSPSKSSNKSSNKSNNNSAPSGGETLQMNATAYSIHCSGCNGKGITATGINLKSTPKVIAVDPNVIPLGTRVWVEGYGNAIAGDTGGAIKGNRIDVHVPSRAEALQYGRKTVTVKILD